MKRIGFIFLLLMFCGTPLRKWSPARSANAATETEVSPATETEEPIEPAMEMAEPDEPAAMPVEVEEPPDATASLPPWQGKRRVLTIVNDYRLAADEVVTTLVLIAGDATLHGTVTGNVLVLGGDVEFAPTARLDGTLRVLGGQVSGGTGMGAAYLCPQWLARGAGGNTPADAAAHCLGD